MGIEVDGELFTDYPAMPSTISAIGTGLEATGPQFARVNTETGARVRDAGAQAEGDILPSLLATASPVATRTADLAAAAVFCGGVVQLWSEAITTYNRGLIPLNNRWRDAVSRGDLTPELTGELRRQEGVLESELDGSASELAGRLAAGPSGAQLAALFDSGAITAPSYDSSNLAPPGSLDAVLIQLITTGVLPPGGDDDPGGAGRLPAGAS